MFRGNLCEPCKHLADLTQPAVTAALVHRGGLRAEIITSGMIQIGDIISDEVPMPEASRPDASGTDQ